MRVHAFVDGFNLYHAIKGLEDKSLRWLNLRALCENLTSHWEGRLNKRLVQVGAAAQSLTLERVQYFSALADWKPEGMQRHRAYIKALEQVDVESVLGSFNKGTFPCSECHEESKRREEKKTDVNLALEIVLGSIEKKYDIALVVTNDSDQVPSVKLAVENGAHVVVVTPPHSHPQYELVKTAQECNVKLFTKDIAAARFDPKVKAKDKGRSINCPPYWTT